MKKNFSAISLSLVISFLLIVGCQKETNQESISGETPSEANRGNDKDGDECRLVSATNTDPASSQDFTFRYNRRGLAHEWDITNYGLFSQEFDRHGKLIRSVHTVEGEVVFTVRFFYRGDRLYKEIFYFGTSTDVMDEAFYHYDSKGRLIKVQSFVGDYIARTTYNRDGNIIADELSFGGVPYYAGYYTYDKHYKNPFLAIGGIDHGFPYYTPATYFTSKSQFSSAKQVAYDENGEPIILFEYDPSKTIWNRGPRNYPEQVTYLDKLSNVWYPYSFGFENCGRGGHHDDVQSRPAPRSSVPVNNKVDFSRLLKRQPGKTMQQHTQDWRNYLKTISR